MKTNATTSRRKYEIVMHESVDGFHNRKLSLDQILFPEENDFEYIYALNDIVDKVMDLPSGHAMYFQPNRDNKDSYGIVSRND